MSAPSRVLADRSNPSNRRMARRGGVKRISSGIYEETRGVMKDYLIRVLRDICAMVDHGGRKTCTVSDVVWVLKRLGRPIYGFGSAER
ncbi:Histone H4 protein [Rutstroemia sp. NJR-2017a BBW]|nr:Histone H4 protein [Rutstroemia sp. NJR-2017a BBW]